RSVHVLRVDRRRCDGARPRGLRDRRRARARADVCQRAARTSVHDGRQATLAHACAGAHGAAIADNEGMRLAALALVLVATPAYADGFYYSQAYGLSSARGDGAPYLGESLQLRVTLGWRFGAFSVGPLIGTEMAVQRDGAFLGFVGGDPATGDSDLKTYGIDGRYHAVLHKNLVMYVRGG